MTNGKSNAAVATRNAEFWNELCGSVLARSLGITDASPTSLRRFDDWYFDFYPYLLPHIDPQSLAGRRVLEVGLGYGSVAQKLAEAGAIYTGLDIAEGPVAMANHRLQQSGLPGRAVRGDVLDCPFPDADFDAVVAIGCLHHTGNLAHALEQVRRVLAPGGRAVIMVYSGYSYRRWLYWPLATGRYWLWDKLGVGRKTNVSESERSAYDANQSGQSAPETDFVSVTEIRRLASKWHDVRIRRENIGSEMILGRLDRNLLLRVLGPFVGLDLYASLRK